MKEKLKNSDKKLEEKYNMFTSINKDSPVYNHYNKENFMSGYLEGWRMAIHYIKTGE